MKMFDAIYKCRLCGEEFVECSTSGEESNRSFVMKIMCRAVDLKEPEEIMEPTIYTCHPLPIFWVSNSTTRRTQNER